MVDGHAENQFLSFFSNGMRDINRLIIFPTDSLHQRALQYDEPIPYSSESVQTVRVLLKRAATLHVVSIFLESVPDRTFRNFENKPVTTQFRDFFSIRPQRF